ncbi:MAG: hypothetical protein AB7G28_02960 [Pirellulales bacterium]
MRSRQPSFRSFSFERLEERQMLAGDVTAQIIKGDLVIRGDDFDNGITITAGTVAGTIVVTGVSAGGAATRVNGTANGAITLSGFSDDFKIKMKGGNDTVTITGLTVRDSLKLKLGQGNDTATFTSVTVLDDAKIKCNYGDDRVTITNSVFEELGVKLGSNNDVLSITGTTVNDKTKLKGGRGSNGLTLGAGNMLANLDTDDFTLGSNTAPTVDLNTVTAINENASATLTGTFTDSNVSQTHTLVVDWADANNNTDSSFAVPATSSLAVNQTINSSTDSAVLTITAVNQTTGVVTFSVQHRYTDDGVAPGNNTASDNSTATVTVSDGFASGTDTATITVNNVVPTITDPADTTANRNTEVTVSTTITDPGTLDRFTATASWDDGQASADSINLGTTTITDQVVGSTKFSWNPTTRVLTYKHTYAAGVSTGEKSVTVTVRDDDSATVASQTTTVNVTA